MRQQQQQQQQQLAKQPQRPTQPPPSTPQSPQISPRRRAHPFPLRSHSNATLFAQARLDSHTGATDELPSSPPPVGAATRRNSTASAALRRIMSESVQGFDGMAQGSGSGSVRKRPRKLRMRGDGGSRDEGGSVDESGNAEGRSGGVGGVREEEASREEGEGGQAEREAREEFEREDEDLPQLPEGDYGYLDEGDSFFPRERDERDRVQEDVEGDMSVDEREMQRHLQEQESSFIPETAAPVQADRLGVDDTYLELGKPGRTPPPDEMFASLQGQAKEHFVERHRNESSEMEPDTPADAYKTPGPGRQEGDDSSAMESPSSPAEAAAKRGNNRAESNASGSRPTSSSNRPTSSGRRPILEPSASAIETVSFSRLGDFAREPPSRSSMRSSRSVSADPQNVPLPQSEGPSMLSARESQSSDRSSLSKRPSYLNQRQASQRSSTSSATMTSELSGSDSTLNADYAQLSGGAVSNNASLNRSNRPGNALSRLPSLGSVASYMSHDEDNPPPFRRGVSGTSMLAGKLDRLTEERPDSSHSGPETPRAASPSKNVPTDTVIAQHVQSIQVPETIARDFRTRNRSSSPDRRPASSGGAAFGAADRPRKTLTLKEQNGKIDKLTKENFDLKLKIHFLDQALQSRSDDGVKEMIDKSVQYQTDLANERKESQGLRRRVRELERAIKEQQEAMAEGERQKKDEPADDDDDPTLQAEMHEEILYLRQQLDYSENQVTKLTEESVTRESEKRQMAEHMRSMARSRGADSSGVKETMEMWQDLLNAETGRREQAEEDLRKTREEIAALRIERASPSVAARDAKPNSRRSRLGYARSISGDSEYTNGINGSLTDSSVTMVEQLKHENAELRRDLGAQTSMLTSRNRERERLQQEIEDLKFQRKSDGTRSMAGESIFERSISRAHQRAPSRASDQNTHVTEAERDDWDRKEGQLRDQNAELRLKYQELERTHNTHLQYVSALEGDYQEMEAELEERGEDLRALQTERDEALQAFEEKEAELQRLEQEALAEIDKLEAEKQEHEHRWQELNKRHQKAQNKLERTTDDYKGLQGEIREITNSMMNLEDDKQANMNTIRTLEQQLNETEDELQKWEHKCKEVDQKNRKLEIAQESLHSEISFLREEQEGDKIKIGELEDALNAAQQTIQDEQEKMRELEEEIVQERQQRDVLENQSKEEVQKVLDGLNNETSKTKDEVRRLRRALSAKEVEASSWKQKLEELEESLRHAIGDLNGSKQTILGDIEKLQRDLERTSSELDRAKMEAADKDRLLRHRDGLLENSSLESRRLSDLLDKERSSRKHDLEQFERSSRGQAGHMRTIAQQESRVLELETAYSQDKRKMAALEQQYRDQLSERNSLLFAMWNRLSTLCGNEWAQNHRLVHGEVPSTDVIARQLPAFSKNIVSAVKTVESIIGSFKSRIRSIEKDLSKDYQTLEHSLDMRIKRMDNLERAVHETQTRLAAEEAAQQQQQQQQTRPQASRSASTKSVNPKSSEEIGKLKTEVKLLKAELKFHRQHPSALAQQLIHQQSQTTQPSGAGVGERRVSASASATAAAASTKTPSPARSIMNQFLQRSHTSSVAEQLQRGHAAELEESQAAAAAQQAQQQQQQQSQQPAQASEQRWVHRLKELERRLKAEREARLLDRRGARQRLEEGRVENEELRLLLEREKVRRESWDGGGGAEVVEGAGSVAGAGVGREGRE
ncbi:hypothetical protein MBLNU230_g1284t1 [Neophaeotheca triangularis]